MVCCIFSLCIPCPACGKPAPSNRLFLPFRSTPTKTTQCGPPKRSTHDIRFIFACQVKNLFRGKVHQNAKKKRYYVPDLGAKAGHISIIRARHPLYSCLVCGPVASASAAASLRGLLLPCEPMDLRFTPLFQQRAALLTEISAAAYGRIWQIVTGEALPED